MHGTSAGIAVPLTTFGGLVAMTSPESLPEGVSPRTSDTDFRVGSVFTRNGLTSVYSYPGSTIGANSPSAARSNGWTNPSGAIGTAGVAKVTYTDTNPLHYLRGHVPTPPALDTVAYAFNLSPSTSVTGVSLSFRVYGSAPGTLTAQLLLNGVPTGNIKQVAIGTSPTSYTLGGGNDLWGCGLTATVVNNAQFGVEFTAVSGFTLATASLNAVALTLSVATGAASFTYVSTFTDQDGSVRNLSLDANGNWWLENVTTAPGQLSLIQDGIAAGSYANSVSGQGVQFTAFTNLSSGSDVPRQYTKGWVDRISQVGPGAAPQFSAMQAASTSYPIASISQPAQKSYGFAYFLQSAGVGSQTPGSVATVYYADSTVTGADTDLVNAFNSGQPVYLYLTYSGAAITQGPYTVLVTSIGLGKPPGQPRQFYYFTYTLPTTAYVYYQGSGHASYNITYQRTLATLTTSVPVPQISVGNQIVVSGETVTQWNSTWTVTQTLNSGAMAITQTSLNASGVGTYAYTVFSGANPVAGQLVTVTGTLNANGAMNVVNVPIATVTGSSSGSFTINYLPAGTAYSAEAEQGQAVTAGTLFAFDPGLATLGTSTSPIYAVGGSGALVINGSGQVVAAGTRKGTVFFITRNGYYTAPAPPVTFTTPANTTSIQATHIPIGPANVIARGILFTEAGQNGVPGANYFYLPTDVQYTVNNVSYTATSTIIHDNTTTSASFFFTDAVLLNAAAADVQGGNLFNLIEIGDPGWIAQYDSRNFYGLCRNKVQNFNNLSFDGGYLASQGNLAPLGWGVADNVGTLLTSPIFGNSYYIRNATTSTSGNIGLITQSAYQDAYDQPILQPNTRYGLRITCRAPAAVASGNLNVLLVTNGITIGQAIIYLGSMKTYFQTYEFPNWFAGVPTIPTSLQLWVYGVDFAPNADVEIDRLEIYPADNPILNTTVFASYALDYESVDAVSGRMEFSSENQQPANGALVLYDTLYVQKEASLYSTKAQPNLEPAQWDISEVSQVAGAIGPNAFDFGEQWTVSACRKGVYLYEGGQPGKLMQEIQPVWEAIHWAAAKTIWVRNDVKRRRLLIGVPLPTPNFWLPNASANAAPTSPNVILACNYEGVDTGEGLKVEAGLHVTMFGNLEAGDERRKWSIWTIPSPYARLVKTATDEALYIGNGLSNSKMYQLDPSAATDDGVPINSVYTTYGWVNLSKAAQFPPLGSFRKLWKYITLTVKGSGTLAVRLLANTLLGPADSTTGYQTFTVPGGFTLTASAFQDRECALNFQATRTFVEFSGPSWDLSNVTLHGIKSPWNALTGQK